MKDDFENLRKMKEFNKRQDEEPVHWTPVSNLDKKELERQEILRKVEEYHRAYVDLWLSHLKGR